jgi:Amidase
VRQGSCPRAPDRSPKRIPGKAAVQIKDEHARVLQEVDVLATLTALIAAPGIDAPAVALGGAEYGLRGPGSGRLARCTNPSNATGPLAITVPCGFSRAGLPIGVQFIGRPFDEVRLVQAAHAYEEVSPSRGRRPAIVDKAEERNNPRTAICFHPCPFGADDEAASLPGILGGSAGMPTTRHAPRAWAIFWAMSR